MPFWARFLGGLLGGREVAWRDGRFPNTHPCNLANRTAKLQRRRAKNKVARASRRANRR